MLSVLSQPHKLILEATVSSKNTPEALCWYALECMASQFLQLAQEDASILSKSTSLILNHFEMIMEWRLSETMAPMRPGQAHLSSSYPNHILELICAAVVLLTQKDREIYSFVITTVQKCLFSSHSNEKIGKDTTHSTQTCRKSSKSFVIILLTGYLLNEAEVEDRDHEFLLQWMETLVTVPTPEKQNLQWIIRFLTMYVRNGNSQASDVKKALLTRILPKMNFKWRPYDPMCDKDKEILHLSPNSTSNNREVLIVDLDRFVSRTLDQLQAPIESSKKDYSLHTIKQTSPLYVHIDLLKTLFYCFVTCIAFESRETGVPYRDVAVLLPSLVLPDIKVLEPQMDAIQSMHEAIYCTVCSVHLLVDAINVLARCGDAVACQILSTEMESCLALSRKVDTAFQQLEEAIERIERTPSRVSPSVEPQPGLQDAFHRLDIVRSHLNTMQSTANPSSVAMYDLELKSVLIVFNDMNWQSSWALECSLLEILIHALGSTDRKRRGRDPDAVPTSSRVQTIMEYLSAVAHLGSRTITLFNELNTSSEASRVLELVYLVLGSMLQSTTTIDAARESDSSSDFLLGEYTDVLVVAIADGVATALGTTKGEDVPLLACCEFLYRSLQVQASKLKVRMRFSLLFLTRAVGSVSRIAGDRFIVLCIGECTLQAARAGCVCVVATASIVSVLQADRVFRAAFFADLPLRAEIGRYRWWKSMRLAYISLSADTCVYCALFHHLVGTGSLCKYPHAGESRNECHSVALQGEGSTGTQTAKDTKAM